MLHWLAGQKQADGPNDPDATGYVEPPETPAPVFAVRAFKHAIFGTPQTAQPRARRHSNLENARPIVNDSKSSRPGIVRPKSSSDAPTMAKQEIYLEAEPLTSPTKGILLSPGTATARRKNVTFGENVVDNEEKRPLRSGTSEDSPENLSKDAGKCDESPGKGGKGRTKLAQALEQARDESKKRKGKVEKRGKTADNDDPPSKEFASPKSESGKYWKHEYDIYRANTQHEVKKLITKQKAAKSFAQMKDEQCTELATQLRQEQRKAEKLEARTAELASLVEDLQNQLRASKDAESSRKDEIARLKDTSRGQTARPAAGLVERLFNHRRSEDHEPANPLSKAAEARATQRLVKSQSRQRLVPSVEDEPVQRPSEPYNLSATTGTEKSKRLNPGTITNVDIDKAKSNGSDDIWAQSFRSSSPPPSRTTEKAPNSTSAQPSVPIETNPNPLQSLDLNTLTSNLKAKRSSLENQRKLASGAETSSKHTLETERAKASEPLQTVPVVSARVSQLLSDAKASQLPGTGSNHEGETNIDASHNPLSSSFQTDISIQAQRSMPLKSNTATYSKTTSAPSTKENVPPDSSQSELKSRPSAVWNSMNSSSAGKRNTSFTGKDGKEVSLGRIEAARARIAARSRGTTAS